MTELHRLIAYQSVEARSKLPFKGKFASVRGVPQIEWFMKVRELQGRSLRVVDRLIPTRFGPEEAKYTVEDGWR